MCFYLEKYSSYDILVQVKKQEVVTGIILRADRHKENDLKLVVLTSDVLISVFASGILKPGAKLKGALQLFNIVELTLVGMKVMGAHVVHNSIGLTNEINRFYLAGLISRFLCYIAKETSNQEIEQIYSLTTSVVILLATTQISVYKIFILFFSKLVVILGYNVTEFEHSNSLNEFTNVNLANLDNIKLSLDIAKECVVAIKKSYIECLDYELDVQFLLAK